MAHLSLVAVVLVYTKVHLFPPVVETTVPVDIVVDEKKPQLLPSPTPIPTPDFSLTATQPSTSAPASLPSAGAPAQQPAAGRRDAAAQPSQGKPSATQPTTTSSAPKAATPSYAASQPDVTVKYGVMLGLPDAIPVTAESSSGDKHGEGGDTSPATDNLNSSLVDALRKHLRTCSKRPAEVTASDSVAVKLRVQMTPDGRLAGEPVLMEGSASIKGVALMQGAIAALSACQPYGMLPADRYGEWKVLELSFTPRDFS